MKDIPEGTGKFKSKDEYIEFKELIDKVNTTNHSFKRYVVLLAAGSLSVIISFHKTNLISSDLSNYCYFATLILIAIGILSLAISLYGDVKSYRLAALKWWEQIQQRSIAIDETVNVSMGVSKHAAYERCEWIGYVALLLAVVCFVILAIASN